MSYSQVVNQRLQLMFLFDPAYQKGLLATKDQRVYFADGSERAETLPDNRFKIPLGVRANYFLGDNVIIRSFYRYYQDDWGLKAHTIDLETAIKLTPFVSLSPFIVFMLKMLLIILQPMHIMMLQKLFIQVTMIFQNLPVIFLEQV